MKTYEKYKDSGIEWIGEIPEHWERTKVKYISSVVNGATPSSKTPEYWDGNIVWITPDDIGKLKSCLISDSKRKITPEGLNSCGASLTPKNSVILSTRAPIGHIGLSQVDTCTNQGCKTLIPNNILVHHKFLYYYLIDSKHALQNLGQGATFVELSSQKLKEYIGLLPSHKEQTQIASYLDHKTSLIDKLIERNEKLIDLLEEQRSAIINQAVTKGLDPNVKMKDSGIEWIGEIPQNWNICVLKYSSYIKGRIGWQGLKANEFLDDGYAYLITGIHFKDSGVDWDSCYQITKQRYDQAPGIQIKKDDLLITKDGTIGKLAYIEYLPGYASLNSHLLVIRSINNSYINRFLFRVFESESFQYYVNITQTGTTFYGITQEKVENFVFAVPDLNTQNRIVNYLDHKTSQIDKLIAEKREINDYLREYRTALISNVVTGKIDVWDEVIPQNSN